MFKKLFLLLLFNLFMLVNNLSDIQKNQDTLISYLFLILLTIMVAILISRQLNKSSSSSKSRSLIVKKLVGNKNAMIGLVIIIFLLYISILAPFIIPDDPLKMNWGSLTQGPSMDHYLGTDEFGRDILSRTIYGTRIAMGIGIFAVLINSLIGTTLGLIAGYYGGKVDNLIMRFIEMFNSIPFILLAIALMSALGAGLFNLIIVVSITGMMQFARIIRGSVLQEKEKEYILAAEAMGNSDFRILIKHILPNCLSPVIVLSTLRIGEMILTIAGLSFLGLGIQPPTPSLGSMLSSGQQYISENIMMSIAPGTMILLIVFAFNLLGDGLRDAFDSKLTN
ncbi:ABC transporter permease [Orenia marismortui]|uniref:Peptide/nickel transport system permease protein n=1 Tax=Orenia marismortui TaxID=46469 RepID=A0A4R8GLC0_9FIRM|nr:ABC transporter permease [Orenia marismortui]TDX46462.1 peptide/nickel transport system permease protein [Orenia marismortui]